MRSVPPPRWRDVYIAAAARGVSFLGDLLAATALTLALTDQGGGGWTVAALLLSASVPPVVLASLAGRMADRFDSRLLLVTVAVMQAGCCVVMAGVSSSATLIALNTLLAVGLAVTQPVFALLAPAMVGVDNVPRASAISQTAVSTGMVTGPALAGLMIGLSGLRTLLLLDAATFLAIAWAGLIIVTRRGGRPPRTAGQPSHSAPLAAGGGDAYTVRGDRLLVAVFTLVAVVVAAVCVTDTVLVFFVRETLGASTTAYGVVTASWVGGLVVGSWSVARRGTTNTGYTAMLIGSLVVMCVAVVLSGLAPGAWWLVPTFLLGGYGNGVQSTATGLLVVRRAPQSHRGRAFAAMGAFANAATTVGFALGGGLLEVSSPRSAILGSGLTGLLLTAVLAAPLWSAFRRSCRR
jgi:MFS family permease